MGHKGHRDRDFGLRHARALLAICAAALSTTLALTAPSAQASFEQVGCFAGNFPGLAESCKPVPEEELKKAGFEFSEEVQLGGVGSLAVNYTGAGGVAKGTVYATTRFGPTTWIARYGPQGQGLEFLERWKVTPKEEAYERCGPALGKSGGIVEHPCTTHVEASPGILGIAVDQATGNVYLFNGEMHGIPEARLITVYKPDGASVVARFGKRAEDFPPKPFSETSEEFHDSAYPGGIAVTDTGKVYAFDVQNSGSFNSRLMVFEPETPGDYSHYKYSGEVLAGTIGQHEFPAAPVLDAAGNIYTQNGFEGETIRVFSPQTPTFFPAPAPPAPICSLTYSKGGIYGMTVNPLSREVFFYSYKVPKRVRRLGPCDPSTGKFTELTPEPEAFGMTPARGDLSALAFDPQRQLEGRAKGVLYGAAPGPVPISGVGKGEPGETALGYSFALALENPPVVSAESVAKATTTSAQLQATIDPEGHASEYAFQYLTEAAYEENGESFTGAAQAPTPPAKLASTEPGQSGAVTVSGLVPGTAYRWRAVAKSECKKEAICEGSGTPQVFRTFAAEVPGLPDGRAWELVSPAEKHGGQVMPADPSVGSTCPETDCKPGATYEHFPMQSAQNGDAIVYEGSPFSPSGGALIENEYISRRDPKAGWQTTNLTPSQMRSHNLHTGYKAFDESLGEGVLEQVDPALSPQAPSGYDNLYAQPSGQPLSLSPALLDAGSIHCTAGAGSGALDLSYAGASRDLSRVFFSANDALVQEASGGCGASNLYEWQRPGGQIRLVNVLPGGTLTAPGASFGPDNANQISADGSRAFWSDSGGQLYVREDGERTLEIHDPGKLVAASTDGSKALLDDGCLYDLAEEACEDLTEDEAEVHQGGFQALLGQSEDLSRAYFVDSAVLDETPNAEGEVAQTGKENLYARSEGTTRFVARLLAQDKTQKRLRSQASSDGGFFAFLSKAPLTGYDNTGPCESNHKGGYSPGPCAEAFLYDASTGALTCPSCNPTNARPQGGTELRRPFGQLPRYLTDEGRLLFDSRDSLSPFDTNEGAEDVYEFEPEGVGGCKRESGCVVLISAGHEPVDSNFLAMDESGKNVFFTTRDQLALKDRDDLYDLYDAREGGGIPAESEVARGECQGEACQAAVSAPNDPTPGSSSFQGAGNVGKEASRPARCAKGKIRRRGRCVAKKHRRHAGHRRRANHHRGGAK